MYTYLLFLNTMVGWAQVVQQDLPMHDLRKLHLAPSNLATYEQQAILKLKDILDYVALIGCQEYETTMRKTVLESVLSTFDPSALAPCDWMLPISKTRHDQATCTLSEVLNQLFATKYNSLQMDYQNIVIRTPLKQDTPDRYLGQLMYQQVVRFKTTSNAVAKETRQTIVLDVALNRAVKHFGMEQEKIWEIQFLGVTSLSK